MNALVSIFWALCTAEGVDPWIERVSSEANLEDPVSRHRRLNVVELETAPWNDAALWELTRRSVEDPQPPHTVQATNVLLQLALDPAVVPRATCRIRAPPRRHGAALGDEVDVPPTKYGRRPDGEAG